MGTSPQGPRWRRAPDGRSRILERPFSHTRRRAGSKGPFARSWPQRNSAWIGPDFGGLPTFGITNNGRFPGIPSTRSIVASHMTTNLTAVGTSGPASRLPERPVFVADHGWRQVLIRATIVLGAVLLAAWLIALVASALGWGNLPGLPFSEGIDHGRPGASVSQEKSAAEPASVKKGPSSIAERATSPSADRRASSSPIGSSLAGPTGSRSPIGALSTPKKTGAGSQSPVFPSPPAQSGTAAGTGSQQSPGSKSATQGSPSTTPGQGAGSRSGNGGSAAPSALQHEAGQPVVTPSGNVPTEDAHGGNPNALAYGKDGSPSH
jgi:hypothetical protein